ncbi:MAG: DUF1398 family protein [Candidatus Obscuribacterales bacterium]|nr:DUF1398 family protein [Candidatus Obscuribacterales bacterium]
MEKIDWNNGEFMNIAVIKECTDLSLAGKITFPEVVKKLSDIGTERYTVDLVGKCKYSYGLNDEVHNETLTFEGPQIAKVFDTQSVKDTIADIQQGKISYVEFLHRIMEAGCSHYEVFIRGKQAIYFGRDGSQHVERFLQNK